MSLTKSQMLDAIRKAVGECEGDERDVLDTLLDEAECWRMRMAELADEGGVR